jgi:glutathionylspermidine synthase
MPPRPDWRTHVERDLGFVFHSTAGAPYWDETCCYEFTADEVDTLEAATGELERMCLELVDRVVKDGDGAYDRLFIPRPAREAIQSSWMAGEKSLYGRFDLRFDGKGSPQLLEYNADTPTALFEAAVVQWDWLEAVQPGSDQFNSIHEKLIEAWKQFGLERTRLYFSAVKDHPEDDGTVEYLRDTAVQAGLDTARIAVEDIGWDGERFLDLDDAPIDALFKLYPWEWIVGEEFGQPLLSGVVQVIEPAWKMVLSNKAALSLLWEMAPHHPNLLPAALEPGGFEGAVVRKPIFGREGANVQVIEAGRVVAETGGRYGAEGFVYQAHAPLPAFDGNYPVIGSWVVGRQPAGIGIREDSTAITRDTSRFVPHYFK